MYRAIVERNKLERARRLKKHNKLMSIREALEKDLKAADFLWSLFVAACQNHKYDILVKPFPPMFVRENERKDIDRLLIVIQDTPPFTVVLQKTHDPDVCEIDEEVIELLYWLFVTESEPHLKIVDQECFDSVLSRALCEKPILKPDFIYQVVRSNKSTAAIRWRTLCRNDSTLFAYHGCNIENYFSMIYNGMKFINKDLCKQNDLFEYGICMSQELPGSIPFSPFGYGWGGSTCASNISCTAACEYINNSNNIIAKTAPELRVKDSQSKELVIMKPEEYISVTNAHLIEVRYLLVYIQPMIQTTSHTSVFDWLKRHKLVTFLFGYGVLLSTVGLMSTDLAIDYYRCC